MYMRLTPEINTVAIQLPINNIDCPRSGWSIKRIITDESKRKLQIRCPDAELHQRLDPDQANLIIVMARLNGRKKKSGGIQLCPLLMPI